MKQKKIIIGIGIAIGLLIIVAIIGVLCTNSNKKEVFKNLGFKDNLSSTSEFDPNNLIRIEKDHKIGYITSKGEMVIEPQYETSSSNFYGNYAKVKKEDENKDDYYMVINQKGEELYKFEYSSNIEHIDLYDIWIIDEKLYDSNLKQITPDDVTVEYINSGYLEYTRYEENDDYDDKKFTGIMNYKGKSTYETDDCDYFSLNIEDNDINNEIYGTITIRRGEIEKTAIVNCETGKIVVDFTENTIIKEEDNIFDVYEDEVRDRNTLYCAYIENDKIAYKIDGGRKFKFFYKKEYKILEIEELDGNVNDYYSLIDGQTYTYREIKNAPKDETKLLTVEYLNKQYTEIEFLEDNLFKYLRENENKQIVILQDNSSSIIYDLNSKQELFKLPTTGIREIMDSSFIKANKYSEEKIIVYNLISGRSMNFDENLKLECGENYLKVIDGNTEIYYNTEFEEIYKQQI